MATISLSNIQKEYGDLVAVNDIDLEIEDGQFFCLLGPSGCGKTTTLRMIAGLEKQTSGQIHIDDEDISDQRPRERDLAMVFQDNAVYPHLNVFENLAFPLRARGKGEEEIDDMVHRVSETLGIEEKLDDDPSQLSGGQQQRIALGRAMIRDPKAFLMDEPLSDLDAKLRRDMRVELSELQTELGATTIYVTHDQIEAMTMGDQIALLRDGQVEQVGPPLDVYNEPVNTWVGEFLGEPGMTFFNAAVEGDSVVADSGVFELPVPSNIASSLPPRVMVGVRPENIEVGVPDGIEAVVEATEKVGDAIILHLNADGAEFTAQVSASERIERGEEVSAEFTERVHFFDEDGDIVKRIEGNDLRTPGMEAKR